jgi:hypothetical protein
VIGLVALGGLGGGLAIALSSSGTSGSATPAAVTTSAPVADSAAAPTTAETAGEEIAATVPATGDSTVEAVGESTTAEKTGTTEAVTTTTSDTEPTTEAETETATTAPESTDQTTTSQAPEQLSAPTILSGPDDPTESRRAAFRFNAPGATSYRCSLDGGAFAACSGSRVYSGLASGRHRFSVRAVRGGTQGPASSFSWTITEPAPPPPPPTTAPPTTTEPPKDTTPPSATITNGPPNSTTETSASFSFSANEPASFTCSLDGSGFSSCSSPKSYQGLSTGQHTFTVRATDDAGNTGGPTSYSWTIAPPALPDLVISSLTPSSVTVSNVGNAPAGAFAVTVDVPGGTFTFSGLAAGASQTRTWSTCVEGQITAVADSGGQVAESNEGNNSRSAPGVIC